MVIKILYVMNNWYDNVREPYRFLIAMMILTPLIMLTGINLLAWIPLLIVGIIRIMYVEGICIVNE